MKFDTSILREADIRGIYPTQVNAKFANRLGLVFGTYVKKQKQKYVVVGHDNRFGGPQLTKGLIDGLISTGINVIFIGLVTTPMLNFASRMTEVLYGVMITASHNPKEDNGFKLFGRDYQHCDYDELDVIYDAINNENYKIASGKGKIIHLDVYSSYAKFLAESINIKNKNIKAVIDCGNGTSSVIVKKVYDLLPFETVYINSESDPSFPNHHPDPNVKSNLRQLQKAVLREKADVGFSYDGDADRCGFVDNKGNIVEADVLMAIMAKSIIKENKNKTILIDVKCTKALEDVIKEAGGKVYIETPSSAKQERVMNKTNIPFGGGYSNHIFFKDRHSGYDDGIYVGLRVQELLSNSKKSLYEMSNSINKYYNTEEIKVKTSDATKFKIVDGIKEYAIKNNYDFTTIDGVKVYKDDSWALVRASNTGPNLTLRFESTTKSGLINIQKEFKRVLDELQNK